MNLPTVFGNSPQLGCDHLKKRVALVRQQWARQAHDLVKLIVG
jgi:hypothetical protein